MPGICGIITRRPMQEDMAEVDIMTQAMSHDSFHRRDKLLNIDAGFVLGWSCIQGGFSDCLPVWNEKKTCLLVFTGRAYFDKEDITALKSRKHSIGRQNASVLIHAYEERGPEFLEVLNGVYCGLIFDFEKKSGFIFTDRLGLERLYYYETGDSFYFASE